MTCSLKTLIWCHSRLSDLGCSENVEFGKPWTFRSAGSRVCIMLCSAEGIASVLGVRNWPCLPQQLIP